VRLLPGWLDLGSRSVDLTTYFLHDVPQEVARESEAHQRPEADIAFREPCGFEAWPSVPTNPRTLADRLLGFERDLRPNH
jgi:hypothetical protein